MTARSLLVATLATLLAACGSSSTPTGTAGTAKMNVRLVDAPTLDYTHVLITVRDVQIQSDAGWTVLGTVNETIDLLALQNGAFKTLALDAELPPGHYGQMRLTLSTDPGAIMKDGTFHKVPFLLMWALTCPFHHITYDRELTLRRSSSCTCWANR